MARLDVPVWLPPHGASNRQRDFLMSLSRSAGTLSLILLLSFSLTSLAQIGGTTAGIVPFGSYMPVEAGTVNLANLNVLFEIPFRNKPGFFFSSIVQNEV